MAKLTKRQIEVLCELRDGERPRCQRRVLDNLQRMGLAKLHVAVGWSITPEGTNAIITGRTEHE